MNTARLLLSAWATNSTLPSAVRLRLLGVLPDRAEGYRAQEIVWTAFPAIPFVRKKRIRAQSPPARFLPVDLKKSFTLAVA